MHAAKSFRFLLTVLTLLLLAGYLIPSSSAAPSAPSDYRTPAILISDVAANQYRPDIAYNSQHDEYLVVWENLWAGGYHDVYAQRVSGSGQLLSWFAVSTSTYSKMNPSVAYDPTRDRYLVVFSYDAYGTGGDWDIYGRYIPWNGPSASLTDFVICNWASLNQLRPVVAFGRAQDEYLVTWTNAWSGQPSYISARRVFADGSGFPSNPFLISSGPENRDYQDVTYNLHRNEYLITWDVDKSGTGLDIYGERLAGNGSVLTGGTNIPPVTGEFPIAGWPDKEERPAVAACDQADQYLVAWQSDLGTGGTDYAVYGYYLNGDAVPVHVFQICDTTSPDMYVEVGCDADGDRYLLAWQSKYVGGEYSVWARLAFPDRSLGTDFEVVGPRQNADREFPGVAGGFSNFLVAWEHDRDGGANKDIYGRFIGYMFYLPLLRK
jgi:hypothetical protein